MLTPPTCFIRVWSFLKLVERALTLLRSSSSVLGSQRWEEVVHVVHTYTGCVVRHFLCVIVSDSRSVSFSFHRAHKVKCFLPSSVLGLHARKVTSAYLLCQLGRNKEAAEKLRKVQEVSQLPGYMYVHMKWPCTSMNTHTPKHICINICMYVRTVCESLVSNTLQNQAYPRSYHPGAKALCTYIHVRRYIPIDIRVNLIPRL